jgi:hypothetical protein
MHMHKQAVLFMMLTVVHRNQCAYVYDPAMDTGGEVWRSYAFAFIEH